MSRESRVVGVWAKWSGSDERASRRTDARTRGGGALACVCVCWCACAARKKYAKYAKSSRGTRPLD